MDINFGFGIWTVIERVGNEIFSLECPPNWQKTNPSQIRFYFLPSEEKTEPPRNAFTIQYPKST